VEGNIDLIAVDLLVQKLEKFLIHFIRLGNWTNH